MRLAAALAIVMLAMPAWAEAPLSLESSAAQQPWQRYPGWNKFTVAQAIPELSVFFGDAVIVWKDSTAYSVNPTTADLIGTTSGVSKLSSLASSDVIWVKY